MGPIDGGGTQKRRRSHGRDYVKSRCCFLRAKQVVISLTNGMSNHDDIHDFQRTLNLLPTDLGRLYIHIFSRIEPPFYLEQASKIFQLVRAAREVEALSTVPETLRSKPLTILLSFAYEESFQDHRRPGSLNLTSLGSSEPVFGSQCMANLLNRDVLDFWNWAR